MKALVTYFSASGVTKNLAIKISRAILADLVEIVPEKLYTKEDLDWTKQTSRSTIEMKDKASRPQVKNKILNINDYRLILVGFPIWWYREPSIIDTFLESYDFANKKVILFATSGGSGISGAINNTKTLKGHPNIVDGKRLNPSISEKEIKEWLDKYL